MHKCQEENVNLPGAKETPRIHSLAAVQHYKIEIMACWKMAISLLETLLLCKCQGSTSGRARLCPDRECQCGSVPVPASLGVAGSRYRTVLRFWGGTPAPRPSPHHPSGHRHPLRAPFQRGPRQLPRGSRCMARPGSRSVRAAGSPCCQCPAADPRCSAGSARPPTSCS